MQELIFLDHKGSSLLLSLQFSAKDTFHCNSFPFFNEVMLTLWRQLWTLKLIPYEMILQAPQHFARPALCVMKTVVHLDAQAIDNRQ